MEYKIGDFVLKGADVFRIAAVEERALGSLPPEDYLVLEIAFPAKHKQGTSYIPISRAEMSIRAVPTETETRQLFEKHEDARIVWDDNRNKRINEARSVISSGDLQQAVELVRMYRKRVAEVPEKDLSTKDREMEGRCFDLLSHVMAAACDLSAEQASQLVDGLL